MHTATHRYLSQFCFLIHFTTTTFSTIYFIKKSYIQNILGMSCVVVGILAASPFHKILHFLRNLEISKEWNWGIECKWHLNWKARRRIKKNNKTMLFLDGLNMGNISHVEVELPSLLNYWDIHHVTEQENKYWFTFQEIQLTNHISLSTPSELIEYVSMSI